MIQTQPGLENQNYNSPFTSVGPGQGGGFTFTQPNASPYGQPNPAVGGASSFGQAYLNKANAQKAALNQQGTQNLAQYMDPNQAGQLLIPANNTGLAQIQGLQLGKLLTGQNIQQTGTQLQDLLQKQLGLTEQGGSNPITAAMQANKAQAVAATNQDLARAGIKGGAASAARLQTSRKMDRDIAAQAYEQYQNAIGQSRQMLGGVASAQLAPMYQAEQRQLAASTPEFKPEKQTLWSFLGF